MMLEIQKRTTDLPMKNFDQFLWKKIVDAEFLNFPSNSKGFYRANRTPKSDQFSSLWKINESIRCFQMNFEQFPNLFWCKCEKHQNNSMFIIRNCLIIPIPICWCVNFAWNLTENIEWNSCFFEIVYFFQNLLQKNSF